MQQYPPSQPSQPFYPPYQQPSYQPPVPSKQPPRGKKKPPKWAMGCGYAVVIVAVLSLCICGATFASNLAHSSSTVTATATSVGASNPTTLAVVATATLATKKVMATPTHSKPKPTATSAPPPKPTSAPQTTGVNGNPWGYDFTPGNKIYSPPGSFCSYFVCIASFWNGRGYVDQCGDGDYSKSGGIRGACSHHGGEAQPLYSH